MANQTESFCAAGLCYFILAIQGPAVDTLVIASQDTSGSHILLDVHRLPVRLPGVQSSLQFSTPFVFYNTGVSDSGIPNGLFYVGIEFAPGVESVALTIKRTVTPGGQGGGGLSSTEIAGIVVGSIIGAALLAAIIVFIAKRGPKKSQYDTL